MRDFSKKFYTYRKTDFFSLLWKVQLEKSRKDFSISSFILIWHVLKTAVCLEYTHSVLIGLSVMDHPWSSLVTNSPKFIQIYRVVKQNCQVEKIVNFGHQNDNMTQKSSLIFLKTIFGWDQVKEILPSLKVNSIEAKIQLLKNP